MGISVRIAPILQEHLRVPGTVEVDGTTAGECLDDLIRRYPELDELIHQGSMLQILIGINSEEAVPIKSAHTPERGLRSGDEIRIFAVLSGG
jgi:molybdopterin converting factor small subunit